MTFNSYNSYNKAISKKTGKVYSKSRGGRPWARICEVVFNEETHCWLCGLWVDFSLPYLTELRKENPGYKSVDHILAKAKGGTDDRENLHLAHLVCNKLKGDGTKEEFLEWAKEQEIDFMTLIQPKKNPQSREW